MATRMNEKVTPNQSVHIPMIPITQALHSTMPHQVLTQFPRVDCTVIAEFVIFK